PVHAQRPGTHPVDHADRRSRGHRRTARTRRAGGRGQARRRGRLLPRSFRHAVGRPDPGHRSRPDRRRRQLRRHLRGQLAHRRQPGNLPAPGQRQRRAGGDDARAGRRQYAQGRTRARRRRDGRKIARPGFRDMSFATMTDGAAAPACARVRGITSVCSAHPLVIEAALRHGLEESRPVLIEATCNQVNHRGGYTGMTPADFRRFVLDIADRVGMTHDRILLGGDHLGPNPWKSLPADAAMDEAAAMVEAYVLAGFTKIHLDTSMGCSGEPVALDNAATAARAAPLAQVAERAAVRSGHPPPMYVIGTEVPVPGGALEEIGELEVTTPEAALETLRIHREAFDALGLVEAFGRVIAAVVQPGVEFGNANVVVY